MATPLFAAGEYAPGMTGGPTGFSGAERFQYNFSPTSFFIHLTYQSIP
tara:strand:+ start:562 stop:705 length:144 start_codon:yes stop_codon:yes gene_type:complete